LSTTGLAYEAVDCLRFLIKTDASGGRLLVCASFGFGVGAKNSQYVNTRNTVTLSNKKAVLLQGGPRDAAVNFDTYGSL